MIAYILVGTLIFLAGIFLMARFYNFRSADPDLTCAIYVCGAIACIGWPIAIPAIICIGSLGYLVRFVHRAGVRAASK